MDAPSPRDLPFGSGRPPWVLRVGLRGVDLAGWLDLEGDAAAELAAKRIVLAEHPDETVAWVAGSERAGDEVRDEVAVHVLDHGADGWHRRGDVVLCPDGVDVDLGDGHGVSVAGRLVPDDVLVLAGPDHRLIAASVTGPNRWRLAEKIGEPLTAIHHPVPGYAETLAAPVGRVLDGLRPDRPMVRRNWAINDDPAVFQPVGAPAPDLRPDEVGACLWLRVERQSVRRLPRTGVVVFTIRTRVWPLAALGDPGATGVAAGLATALEALPDDLAAYKSLTRHRGPVLEWLRTGVLGAHRVS